MKNHYLQKMTFDSNEAKSRSVKRSKGYIRTKSTCSLYNIEQVVPRWNIWGL